MVLAEKSAEVRNGKSRGPSPNGHGSPDSSSENEDVVPFAAEKIRVGRDYQAVCPELEPLEKRRPDILAERALLVWSPTMDISDAKLDNYITVAKDKYGYNAEQALGMLFWHKHDLNRASLDLANFTPFPDEWTVEDKVLFEQAFQFHGKSFHRIRHMLPDKSVASLVKYYYSWKKTRARTSLMDVVSDGRGGAGGGAAAGPGPSAGAGKRDSAANSEKDGSDKEPSDTEEKVQENKQQLSTLKRKIGSTGAELARPGEPLAKVNSRWTSEELLMAVTAVKKYGKDFNAIAEIIGTKTEAHVRTFFISYRRRYNLDAILKEYEAERGNTSNPDGNESASAEATRGSNGDSSGEAAPAHEPTDDDKGEAESEAASVGAEEGGAGGAAGPSQGKGRSGAAAAPPNPN